MSEPGGDPSSGISSGDGLILPERHPACRRREARPVVCVKFSKLVMVAGCWFVFQVKTIPSSRPALRQSRRAASLTERARCWAEPVGGQVARRSALLFVLAQIVHVEI